MTDRPRGLVPGLPDALLAPLLDAAADVLRELEPADVPVPLRRLIGFDRKGLQRGPARQQLQRTLESDDEFRTRVVEHFVARDAVRAALDEWSGNDAVKIVDTAAERDDLPLLASALFAQRPPGWAFGLGVACATFEHGRLLKAEAADADAVRTQLTGREEALRRAEAAASGAKARIDALETELKEERRSRRDREAQAEREVADAKREREQAEQLVGRLTEGKAAADARIERESRRAMQSDADHRALRNELAQVKRELASASAALEHSAVPGAALRRGEIQTLTEAAETAGELARRLAELTGRARRSLDAPGLEAVPDPDSGRGPDPDDVRHAPAPVRPLRAPVALPPGLRDDAPEAFDAMVRTPGVVVLVDGYNVSMQGWPEGSVTAQRDRLIAVLGELHQRQRVAITVVFDGADVVGVDPPRAAGVRVLFSAVDEEADAVIVREAAGLPPSVPVVVVSSDRWVRDHSVAAGARVVSAAQFLAARRP